MRRLALVAVLTWGSGCLDTELPPPPGPGAVTGRVLVAQPRESLGQPVANATVALVESGLSVTTDGEGRFELRPVPSTVGTLRFTAGPLGRLMKLEVLGAGPGRVTVLGDVALSRNAAIQGEVVLEDDPAAEGTLVFVEGEPTSTFTTHDGQFLLRELPVGPVSLAIFRRGYGPVRLPLELRSGERFGVDRVVLRRQDLAAAVVRGQAVLEGSDDSRGITVEAEGGRSASTAASGDYALSAVEPGVRSFSFSHEGYGTVTLANRLIASPEVRLPGVRLVTGTNTRPVVVPPYPVFDGGAAPGAGTGDAGTTTPPDAGADAGIDAGVEAGIDAGVDAGMDAGTDRFPIAVIAPLPGMMLQDAGPILLDGTGSSGSPVLTNYAWYVDAGTARLRDGGIVKPSVNDSATAAAPSLELPLPPAVVTIGLQVTDALGRVSAPTVTGFVVGDRPLALFDAGSLPTALYTNETATIDATPSRDTVGSNLVSRRWVISPSAPVTTTSLDNGSQLRIVVGTVSFNQQMTVSHYVTNGLGFESLERQHTINLLAGAVPLAPWSISTASAFTVDGGTVVPLNAALDGGALSGASADPANYDWSWTSTTDAGQPPRWAITNPAAQNTTVFLPVVDGPTQRFDFMVTATTRPPLLPGSQSAALVVLALDRQRPSLLSNTSSGASASAMGTLLTFSEPMAPVATVSHLDVVSVTGQGSVVTNRIYRGGQVMLVTRPPPTTLDLWEFRMWQSGTTVTDVVGNEVVPLDLTTQYRTSFVPEVRWTPPFELATGELVAEPQPGLLPTATPVLGQHGGLVLARVGSTLVSSGVGSLTQCASPPCSLTPRVFATGVPGAVTPASPYFVHQGAAYLQPAAGLVFSADGGTLPTAPGLVFSQGSQLAALSIDAGTLLLTELDGGAWDMDSATVIATTNASYPIDDTTVVAAAAGAEAGANRTTCLSLLTGTRVIPLLRTASGSSGVPLTNNPAASGLTVTQARAGATPTSCYWTFLQPDGAVLFQSRGVNDFMFTGNLATLVASNVSSVDVIADPNSMAPMFWIATIENGQLFLYSSNGTSAGTSRVSPPSTSLNASAACVASRPVLSQLEQAVYVTWQERCAGQPWKVYVRGLN